MIPASLAKERHLLTPSLVGASSTSALVARLKRCRQGGQPGNGRKGGGHVSNFMRVVESLFSLSLSLSSAAAAFYDFPVQHRVSRGSTTPQHSYITGNFEIVEREFREAVAVRGCDFGK